MVRNLTSQSRLVPDSSLQGDLSQRIAQIRILDRVPSPTVTPLPLPSESRPAVLAEAQESVRAILSDPWNARTTRPTREQSARHEQSSELLDLLLSKIQIALASLQTADRASEEIESLWEKVDSAKSELSMVAASLQRLKDGEKKANVVDEMRKLECELETFTAALPEDKRPLYYNSGKDIRLAQVS